MKKVNTSLILVLLALLVGIGLIGYHIYQNQTSEDPEVVFQDQSIDPITNTAAVSYLGDVAGLEQTIDDLRAENEDLKAMLARCKGEAKPDKKPRDREVFVSKASSVETTEADALRAILVAMTEAPDDPVEEPFDARFIPDQTPEERVTIIHAPPDPVSVSSPAGFVEQPKSKRLKFNLIPNVGLNRSFDLNRQSVSAGLGVLVNDQLTISADYLFGENIAGLRVGWVIQ